MLIVAEAVAAPKVLLHDHLDGGLRTSTVIELADAIEALVADKFGEGN